MDKASIKTRRGTQDRFTVGSLLGIRIEDGLKLAKRIETGLPVDALVRVSRLSGLSVDDLAAVLRIAPRTLARRKVEKRLTTEESDRLVSVARLLALTFSLFEGDVAAGFRWFNSKNRALGGIPPIKAASTETGAREVERLIGRLEHGVFV